MRIKLASGFSCNVMQPSSLITAKIDANASRASPKTEWKQFIRYTCHKSILGSEYQANDHVIQRRQRWGIKGNVDQNQDFSNQHFHKETWAVGLEIFVVLDISKILLLDLSYARNNPFLPTVRRKFLDTLNLAELIWAKNDSWIGQHLEPGEIQRFLPSSISSDLSWDRHRSKVEKSPAWLSRGICLFGYHVMCGLAVTGWYTAGYHWLKLSWVLHS